MVLSMLTDYSLLIAAWILYLASHSVFAAPGVKKVVMKYLGISFAFYRIIYVVFATLLLIPLGIYLLQFRSHWIFRPNVVFILAGILFFIGSYIIGRYAFREYNMREFLGTAYVSDNEFSSALKTSGILAYVRHPLYSATFLIMMGIFVILPTLACLISIICIGIYIFIGIKLEEDKLLSEFGNRYREYREKVPMLIPRLGKLVKNRNQA